MRIPSELHGESLYGRKTAQHRSPPGQSWRRVIRLTIVLVLVLLLMRQAARPGVYQLLFPESERRVTATDLAVDLQTTGSSAISTSIVDSSISADSLRPTVMTSQQRAEFDAWTAERSNEQLIAGLAEWLSGNEFSMETEAPAAVAMAIQQKLLSAAKDGTVWRASDGPALLATLAMHRPACSRFEILRRARSSVSEASLLPLLQQPEVYLGQSLIARGELVRIERVVATENLFGIDHYWNLWLLPADASRRPWMVIASDLPPAIAALTDSSLPANTSEQTGAAKQSWPVPSPHPTIELQGEFIKRLSYQSEAGAELTPVVAGHIAAFIPNDNPTVAAAIQNNQPQTNQQQAIDDDIPLWWIVAGSVVAGLSFSLWVMWRTAMLNQQLRQRRAQRDVHLSLLFVMLSLAGVNTVAAQSLTDLLPGYDQARMEQLTANGEAVLGSPNINVDELAKIVFRITRLSDTILHERLAQSASPPIVGDAVKIDAEIVGHESLTVSSDLQEYLNLDRVEMIQLPPLDGVPHVLFAETLPDDAAAGDRISGTAVRLRVASSPEQDDEPTSEENTNDRDGQLIVDVSGRLKWTPAQPASPAAEVLALAGVDLSRLADMNALDRQPLSEADSPLFFPMIGAAAQVAATTKNNDRLAVAIKEMRAATTYVAPVDLLQNPAAFIGQWIRLDVETVRITRVAVQSKQRRQEIGGDFYYEIDAIGDLGNVQLQIEVPGGEPVTMEDRYPVTIVTTDLPKFLSSGADQLVITKRVVIRVEGFFYRLWGYESDLMQPHGGKQFAPLIIAGVLEDRWPSSADPMGVQIIGKIAAGGVLLAIAGVIVFNLVTRRGDCESRKLRK